MAGLGVIPELYRLIAHEQLDINNWIAPGLTLITAITRQAYTMFLQA